MVPLTGTTVLCSTSQTSAIDVQLTPVPSARRNPRSATACSATSPWIHSRPAANHLPGMAFERSLRVAAIHPSRRTVRGYGLATTARWLKRFGPSGPRDTLQPTTTYFNAHRGQAPRDRRGRYSRPLPPTRLLGKRAEGQFHMRRLWTPWRNGRRPRQVDRSGRRHWLWRTLPPGRDDHLIDINSLYDAVNHNIISSWTFPAVSLPGGAGYGGRRVAKAQRWRTAWIRPSEAAERVTRSAFLQPSREMDAWRWPHGAPAGMSMRRRSH